MGPWPASLLTVQSQVPGKLIGLGWMPQTCVLSHGILVCPKMCFQTLLNPSPRDVLEVNNRQMSSIPVGSQLQKIILTGSKHEGTVSPSVNLICWKEAAPHPGTTCASVEMKVRVARHLHYSLARLISFTPFASLTSKPTKMWPSFHWAEWFIPFFGSTVSLSLTVGEGQRGGERNPALKLFNMNRNGGFLDFLEENTASLSSHHETYHGHC